MILILDPYHMINLQQEFNQKEEQQVWSHFSLFFSFHQSLEQKGAHVLDFLSSFRCCGLDGCWIDLGLDMDFFEKGALNLINSTLYAGVAGFHFQLDAHLHLHMDMASYAAQFDLIELLEGLVLVMAPYACPPKKLCRDTRAWWRGGSEVCLRTERMQVRFPCVEIHICFFVYLQAR